MSKTEKLPIIPGYDVKRMIGQGGMAMVYLAEQRTLQRLVALKIMSPALSADDTFTSRFLKEGATAANLAHPKIIKVFDSGVHDNHYYIAMEYLSGGTLKDKLKTLSIPDALQILKDMTDALSYAHEHGVVHRDIKSQNILMYPDGTPILSDFGVAKALDGSTALTRSGMAIGSPGYMSPEQLRGLPIDGRTDIYALGILFYEMLMGELPYQATDQFAIAYKHIYDPIPELPAKLAIFKPLLDKTLAKDPADRVADAKELLALIERIEIAYYSTLTGDTKGLSSADLKRITLEHKKQPVDKPPRRRSYIMPTALILVVVLAGGGYYYYTLRTADTLSAATTQLLTEANAAKQAGDYQTSLNHIAKALALAPQSQQVIALHREVIALQSRQQQQQQRQAELEQVRQQAQTLYQQGQLQDSLAAIEKGLALAADDSSLLTLRDTIQTDLQRQQQQQTLATLQREAEQLRANGDFTQSLAKLDQALSLNPPEPELSTLRTARTQTQREFESVQAEQARQQQQQIIAAFQREAEQLRANGDFTQSLAKFDQALALNPPEPELSALRTARAQTQREMAAAQAEQARQQQQAIAALQREAEQLRANGDFPQSLAKFDQALALNPPEPELSALRTARARIQSEFEAAQAEQARQQQISQQLSLLKTQIADLRQKGELQASLARVKEGLDLRPDEPDLQALQQQLQSDIQAIRTRSEQLLSQAEQLRQGGQYADSLDTINQALALNPEGAELASLRELRTQVMRTQLQEQAERSRTIAALSTKAATERQQGQLRESLDSIDQALALAPDNAPLQTLRQQVDEQIQRAQGFLEQARQAEQTGELSTSLALIEQGLQVWPQASELLGLRDTVNAALQEREQRLAELMQQAQALSDAGDYQQSLDSIDEALALNPPEAAQNTLQTLREQVQQQQRQQAETELFLARAEQALKQNDYDLSLQLIDRGLALAPEHSGLIALQEQVKQAKFQAENPPEEPPVNPVEQQIAALLATAEQQLKAQRLTTPAGDAAFETYQEILALDPQNKAAREGLQTIADTYLRWAELDKNRQRYQASLNDISKGLSVMPEHSELLALRGQVADLKVRFEETQERLAREREERAAREAKARAEREAQERAARAATQTRPVTVTTPPPTNNTRPVVTTPVVTTPVATTTPNNSAKRAELQQKLQALRKDLSKIQQQRSVKSCDYYENTYGMNDTSVRQRGCHRLSDSMQDVKRTIAQLEKTLNSL